MELPAVGLVSVTCIPAGRRKASVAVAYLVPGGGEMSVNSRSLNEYFPLTEQRQQLLFPLIVTNTLGAVNIAAFTKGGGKTGKLMALTYELFFTCTCMYNYCAIPYSAKSTKNNHYHL